MRVGIRAIPYNHLMRRARKERGLTQAVLAELVGVSQGTINSIERMATKVTQQRASDIACALGYEPDDLFPLECRSAKVASIDFVLEVDSLECIEGRDVEMLALPDPLEIVSQGEIAEAIRHALSTLRSRERRILELRFGLTGGGPMTLEEVAYQFGVTRERILQIEAAALGRLRHPLYSRRLAEYL